MIMSPLSCHHNNIVLISSSFLSSSSSSSSSSPSSSSSNSHHTNPYVALTYHMRMTLYVRRRCYWSTVEGRIIWSQTISSFFSTGLVSYPTVFTTFRATWLRKRTPSRDRLFATGKRFSYIEHESSPQVWRALFREYISFSVYITHIIICWRHLANTWTNFD